MCLVQILGDARPSTALRTIVGLDTAMADMTILMRSMTAMTSTSRDLTTPKEISPSHMYLYMATPMLRPSSKKLAALGASTPPPQHYLSEVRTDKLTLAAWACRAAP